MSDEKQVLSPETMKVLMPQIRNIMPQRLAEQLCSVQPIQLPSDAIQQLMSGGKTEQELIAEGYEPVCEQTRLMWIKKSDKPVGE